MTVSFTTATDTSRQDRTATGLVPALTLATFLSMLHAMAIGPLIPAIADDFGSSAAVLGQISAMSMYLAAALGLVAGGLIDRIGHRRAMVGSTIVVAVSALGMGLAPGFFLLLIAALAGATGRAIVQPVALVIAGDRLAEHQQRRGISWVMAGITGAVIAGVPALTTFTDLFGWRVALGGLAALTALLALTLHRILGPDPAQHPATSDVPEGRTAMEAYRPLLEHRPTVALLSGTLIGNCAVWMMATYLGAFYSEHHDFTTQQIGWAYFVPGVTLFAGSLIAGGRLGALPLRPIVVLTRLIVGITIFGAYALPVSTAASLGLFAAQGLAMGISNVTIVLLLMKESPAGRATTMTLNAAAISLATGLGSMLGGAVLAVAGFEAIGVIALGLSATAAFIVWTVRPRPELVPQPGVR